jgi:hypothetical protein
MDKHSDEKQGKPVQAISSLSPHMANLPSMYPDSIGKYPCLV